MEDKSAPAEILDLAQAREELDNLPEEEIEDTPLTVFATQLCLWHEYDGQRTLVGTRYKLLKQMDPNDKNLDKLVNQFDKLRKHQLELEFQMRDLIRDLPITLEEVCTTQHIISGDGQFQIFRVPLNLKKKFEKSV